MSLRTEKEVEFYKDLFGKVFTTFLLVSGGTLTTFHREGKSPMVMGGTVASLFLLVALIFTGYLYKREINRLEE